RQALSSGRMRPRILPRRARLATTRRCGGSGGTARLPRVSRVARGPIGRSGAGTYLDDRSPRAPRGARRALPPTDRILARAASRPREALAFSRVAALFHRASAGLAGGREGGK